MKIFSTQYFNLDDFVQEELLLLTVNHHCFEHELLCPLLHCLSVTSPDNSDNLSYVAMYISGHWTVSVMRSQPISVSETSSIFTVTLTPRVTILQISYNVTMPDLLLTTSDIVCYILSLLKVPFKEDVKTLKLH